MHLSKQSKLVRLSLILMLTLAVTSCATVSSEHCLIDSPIKPTKEDVEVISDSLVEQILRHNEIYKKICNE